MIQSLMKVPPTTRTLNVCCNIFRRQVLSLQTLVVLLSIPQASTFHRDCPLSVLKTSSNLALCSLLHFYIQDRCQGQLAESERRAIIVSLGKSDKDPDTQPHLATAICLPSMDQAMADIHLVWSLPSDNVTF